MILMPVRTRFRAIACAVVPGATTLDESGWADVEAIVENTLAARPPRMGRQLQLLIRVINTAAWLRYRRPFAQLDAERARHLLIRFENAPVLLLRRGFWGLRTLVLMGYYARPAGSAEIGYRAQADGWAARR